MKRFFRKCFFYGVVVLLLHLIVGAFLERVVYKHETVNGDFHPRTRWKEFHGLENNSVDLIFLGSSHSYRTFNPVVYESELQMSSFNMGSAIQTPLTSLYVLKEALVSQKPRLVVLEIYYSMFLADDHRQYRSASYNFEFMNDSTVKFEFLRKSYGKDVFHILLPTDRYKRGFKYLFNGYAKNEKDHYAGKGYVKRVDSLQESRRYTSPRFTFIPDMFNEKQVTALEDLAQLTKKEGIQLILVTAPITDTMISNITNYDDISKFFQNYSNKLGLKYIDYNMIELGLLDNVHFYDFQHLNEAGTTVLNQDFAKRLKMELKTVIE
ncbi:DUF1574 domain-containing protein [Akkermansiaceae bacterium]|nr:DUF1574 domain-containing protein [Akkermansiaceae bacterium]